MKSLKIGNLKLKNPLFLAPMVEVTDLPYRLICRKAGAAMAYTEMLHISSITHKNENTAKLMKIIKEDRPLGIQITGNKIDEFEKSIEYFRDFDLVDINSGCPSDRAVKSNVGSCLLQNPAKLGKIIKLLKDNELTVTAKVRLGFKKNNVFSKFL